MPLPNENYIVSPLAETTEKEKIKQEIAALEATTSSPQRRKLLAMAARILETEASLIELDEINSSLGREYHYE